MILIYEGVTEGIDVLRDVNLQGMRIINFKCVHLLIKSFLKYLLIILSFNLQLYNITHIHIKYTRGEHFVAILIDKYVFQSSIP